MSPADIPVVWPTADEIARALVAACRIEGDDPILVAQGRAGIRSRCYAVVALAAQFPTPPRRTLATKCGYVSALNTARMELKKGGTWFSLDKLNAVRAALEWPPLTFEEAFAAPLIYCGRPWTEFLPSAASTQACTPMPGPLAAEGVARPEAGSGGKEEPAPIQSSNKGDGSGRCPSPARKAPDAGPGREIAPATISASRKSALARRVIDWRSSGVCEQPGMPPPGRSALDQRARP